MHIINCTPLPNGYCVTHICYRYAITIYCMLDEAASTPDLYEFRNKWMLPSVCICDEGRGEDSLLFEVETRTLKQLFISVISASVSLMNYKRLARWPMEKCHNIGIFLFKSVFGSIVFNSFLWRNVLYCGLGSSRSGLDGSHLVRQTINTLSSL